MASLGTRRPGGVGAILVASVVTLGCGGVSASRSSGGGPADGSPGDTASATGAGGGGGSGADVAAGSTNVVHAEVPGPVDPPGAYVTSETANGSPGACAGVALGNVLAAIRAANSALADIVTVYNPATATTDGSFIYTYDVGVLGFDVVFKRGTGDCLAGCTENEYWYFSTDGSCQPVSAGHYHATWGTDSCLTVDGAAMWGRPTPPDPLTVCNEDNTARDLRGVYDVHGSGQLTPCAVTATSATAVDAQMKLLIDQDPQDLSTGTVTFSLTGDPLVDGVPLPARFQRERFNATMMKSNLPAMCPRQNTVTAHYDFEGYEPGGIEAGQVGDDSCTACKGALSLELTNAANSP
ncbi:MAG TPA: hypothetical protein VGK52_20065 [Polyangia bacterium]